MPQIDPAALIVALTGLAAYLTGRNQNKRGQKAQEAQQRTANVLQGQAQDFAQQGIVIERLQAELERTDEAREKSKAQHEAEKAEMRAQHRVELEKCTEARAELAATVALLSEVLRDEVAKSMAEMAVAQSENHDFTNHGRDGT